MFVTYYFNIFLAVTTAASALAATEAQRSDHKIEYSQHISECMHSMHSKEWCIIHVK